MHEDVLILSGLITKTSTMRQIPKKEALKKWVDTFAKKKGKIVKISDTSKSKQLRKLKDEFGGPIGKDSQGRDLFRHCYASYRFAECKSPNTVSDETGHSVSVLKNNYLKMTSTSDSKQWFGMLPENILPKKENNNDIKPKTIIRTSKGFNSNNYKIYKQTQNPLHANWQKCQI